MGPTKDTQKPAAAKQVAQLKGIDIDPPVNPAADLKLKLRTVERLVKGGMQRERALTAVGLPNDR